MAQQADFIDEILAPPTKLRPDRFSLHLRRDAPHQMKRLRQPERHDLVASLGGRIT